MTICILWEDELRKAARLIAHANALDDDDPSALKAQQAAWAACSTALHGLTDGKVVSLIAPNAILKGSKKWSSTPMITGGIWTCGNSVPFLIRVLVSGSSDLYSL